MSWLSVRLVVVALAGLLLVGFSIPRMAAYAIVAPLGHVREALDQGMPIEENRLVEAYEKLSAALAWLPREADLQQDRARAARRLAGFSGEPNSAKVTAQDAVMDLRTAVAVAPSRSFLWALLADSEIAAGASPASVYEYLHMSWLTGPHKLSAMRIRSRIVLAHWPEMPLDIQNRALADISIIWASPAFRGELIALYLDAGFAARAAIREEMSRTDGRLEQFDRVLRMQVAPAG
ncbi:hypothetical protein [Parvibaculum sp.]|uniref:hypothetical protein n=1 Tax=Parvibaculum sp. TaxID=2024848 RepID=UPI00262BDA4C|nr:hypothetical protein [Parvibaculum sp.]MCW5726919.1 hypothetical protein [Parvibaculum sp.]